jgi:hypothetical protein
LLDQGFLAAANACLWKYGRHFLDIERECAAEGGRSRVDYVSLLDQKNAALIEAKSPSVMKKAGELLPLSGILLTWVPGEVKALVPKILQKVSALLSISLNAGFDRIHAGRVVSGSEKDGMAVSYLPQLLDHLPPCEGR